MQCTRSWYAKIADTGNRLFFALPQKLFRSCSTGPRQSITLASLTNPNQPNRSGMPENLSHPVSAGRQIHVVKPLQGKEDEDELNTVFENQKNDRRGKCNLKLNLIARMHCRFCGLATMHRVCCDFTSRERVSGFLVSNKVKI